ncbi:uncharacterized protein LOC130637714 [Hydractinia symbiolongicarpus]|uniref:uncharacterized protein LOC130637714 n=1 Tax=Hydractinia symbiolongicarpus TaxID=13093 RepID=UPI00254FA963|nr:uncharacterized protein LOC130637714 [Hydractinia symbiolongicarpus]XP_057302934.1 uncharacterized protein LOC130637714 [Hydractinia symbiolongicarpus]
MRVVPSRQMELATPHLTTKAVKSQENSYATIMKYILENDHVTDLWRENKSSNELAQKRANFFLSSIQKPVVMEKDFVVGSSGAFDNEDRDVLLNNNATRQPVLASDIVSVVPDSQGPVDVASSNECFVTKEVRACSPILDENNNNNNNGAAVDYTIKAANIFQNYGTPYDLVQTELPYTPEKYVENTRVDNWTVQPAKPNETEEVTEEGLTYSSNSPITPMYNVPTEKNIEVLEVPNVKLNPVKRRRSSVDSGIIVRTPSDKSTLSHKVYRTSSEKIYRKHIFNEVFKNGSKHLCKLFRSSSQKLYRSNHNKKRNSFPTSTNLSRNSSSLSDSFLQSESFSLEAISKQSIEPKRTDQSINASNILKDEYERKRSQPERFHHLPENFEFKRVDHINIDSNESLSSNPTTTVNTDHNIPISCGETPRYNSNLFLYSNQSNGSNKEAITESSNLILPKVTTTKSATKRSVSLHVKLPSQRVSDLFDISKYLAKQSKTRRSRSCCSLYRDSVQNCHLKVLDIDIEESLSRATKNRNPKTEKRSKRTYKEVNQGCEFRMGFDIDVVDDSGNSCLHHASSNGDVTTIIHLLNRGGNVWKRNKNNLLPVDVALNFQTAKLLSQATLFYSNPNHIDRNIATTSKLITEL